MLTLTDTTPSASSSTASRRQRIGARIGDGAALLLPGGALQTRSNDTEQRFRPDSDFFYLTGLAEPGAVLLLRPGREPEFTLFVQPRDPKAEIWSGRRIGPEGAIHRYGADAAHPLGELAERLPALLDGVESVYLPFHHAPDLHLALLAALAHLHRRDRLGEQRPECLRDARALLGEDRIFKDAAALTTLRRAVEISAEGHLAAIRGVRPGLSERDIEAIIEHRFRRLGASGPGYGTIVGGGDNATILHYVANDAPLIAGQLLLVDAGAELDCFTGDITRTYPISGRFSPEQRDLYQIVLAANEAGIREARVGSDIDAIHGVCLRILAEGLLDLHLVEGGVDEVIEQQRYLPYYMHRTSHWLGADVHDAGHYTLGRRPRPLQPGIVLTVEPALYIPADDPRAPPGLRGCGIRIEDDVLIRAEGPEVLSAGVPKAVAELEAILGSDPLL
ncbi:MAG: aminopeptidase P N-terminal domain-containing protein [Nannocystis sp.]|nr:aminopeptidase P N-terminal domain-containing protein [Nannocystis sp.]